MEPAGSIVPVSLLMATVIPFPSSPAVTAGSAVTQPLSAPVLRRVRVSNAAVIFFFMSYLLVSIYIIEVRCTCPMTGLPL